MNVLDRDQTTTNSKDMLAKLLASENITVIRGNATTASFDTVNRVLTLPMWQNLSASVEDMLIGHEVGHALFTTNEYLDEVKTSRALHSYMNVIEDVRIEKAMKRKYPGLRKVFHQAYTQLQQEDFFELANRDLGKLMLIDRINLYYKAGFKCGVSFTKEEAEFVKRVNDCDTMKDVYELAVEMLAYAKGKKEEEKQQMLTLALENLTEEDAEQEIDSDFDEFADFDDGDFGDETNGETQDDEADEPAEDSDDAEEEGRGYGPGAGSADFEDPSADTEDDLESVTDRALANRLEQIADTDRDYISVEFDGKKSFFYDPILNYKRVIAEMSKDLILYEDYYNVGVNKYNELNNKISRDVSYLVKEFEMRKQAQRMKRTTRAKTGELAVNKLFAYKLTDDLFKRINVVADGKNHGMMMLVDWSGSMHDSIEAVIEQVIVLSTFCKRIQIPFRVYGFTDSYRDLTLTQDDWERIRAAGRSRDQGSKPVLCMNRFHLIEFFSEKMTKTEFTKMAQLLLASPWRYSHNYGLSGTPLNEAMWFLIDHAESFIKSQSVEKFTFITLTDGEGHQLHPMNFQQSKIVEVQTDIGTRRKRVANEITLTDPVTRRNYKLSTDGYRQFDVTPALMKIMKHRLGATTIGYHILKNSAREVGYFMSNNCQLTSYTSEREHLFQEIRTELRRNGFCSSDKFGRDKMFILRQDNLKITDEVISIDNTKNTSSIAKQFAKTLDSRKNNKVVLNQFMELIV